MQKSNYWQGFIFFLCLLTVVLLWRGGYLPRWVYQGALRDEILRRTGFDLADRASYYAPQVAMRNVRAVPGRTPTVIVEFENIGKNPIQEYRAVAVFRTTLGKGPHSAVAMIAGNGKPPLKAGERRQIQLSSATPYDPKTVTGKPAPIFADVYWDKSFKYDGTRHQPLRDAPNELESFLRWESAQPDVSGVVVRE